MVTSCFEATAVFARISAQGSEYFWSWRTPCLKDPCWTLLWGTCFTSLPGTTKTFMKMVPVIEHRKFGIKFFPWLTGAHQDLWRKYWRKMNKIEVTDCHWCEGFVCVVLVCVRMLFWVLGIVFKLCFGVKRPAGHCSHHFSHSVSWCVLHVQITLRNLFATSGYDWSLLSRKGNLIQPLPQFAEMRETVSVIHRFAFSLCSGASTVAIDNKIEQAMVSWILNSS